MLIAHKVIDALRGRDKKYTLILVPGMPDKATCEDVAELINRAQKFDFGDLVLEQKDDNSYAIPALTEDEKNFWREGLIPLPFPVCWYEWVLGGFRSGLLVLEREPELWVHRIDFVRDEVLFDGVAVQLDRQPVIGSNHIRATLSGNYTLLNSLAGERVSGWIATSGLLAIYLTLMLNSKSTESVVEPAPAKLNAARVKRGHAPLAAHRVVRIVPRRFQYERGPLGHERLSPRLHWRRSHLRHYADGKMVVIARMLVGKAELGEVSHEYRIGK